MSNTHLARIAASVMAAMTLALCYFALATQVGPRTSDLPVANAQTEATGRIAFVSYRDGNSEIYVMNADGSDVTRLTHNSETDIEPAWSPDGQQIAFTSGRDGNWGIYVMNADGSMPTRLIDEAEIHRSPSWSPDGQRIAFTSIGAWYSDILVMNADGSGVTRLTESSAWYENPSWSPDGGLIAFSKAENGNREIHIMNEDGSGVIRLTHNSGFDGYPSWSPDGQRIAFESYRGASLGVYVINADGSGVTHLTNDSGHPCWSPDGRHIAFVSTRDGDADIYVINANGTGLMGLNSHPGEDVEPDWWQPGFGGGGSQPETDHAAGVSIASPAGRIAFHSDRDGNHEIYVMNADGSNVTRLTNNLAQDWFPRWSPDGRQIAFSSNRDGDHEIYVMNEDGSGMTQLTEDPAMDWLPNWSPDGRLIVFASSRDGDNEVYVMNVDGSLVTQLIQNQVHDWAPVWSPDGRYITFISDRDGDNEIYVMNDDGSEETRLTYDTNSDVTPSWSHDGRNIAFSSDRDGDNEIYVMNDDGTSLTRLTHNEWEDRFPSWSIESHHIAFHTNRDGNYEIYVMNADGTGLRNVTNNLAGDTAPHWGPGSGEADSMAIPVLVVTPSSYDFGSVTQGDSPEIILSGTNAGSGKLHWGYRSMPYWVDILSTGGLSETGEGTLLVRVRSDAPLGTLSGTIYFSSNGGEAQVTLRAEIVPASMPDLVVDSPTVDGVSRPIQFAVGDTVNIGAWVTNIGSGPAGASGILYQIGGSSEYLWWGIDSVRSLNPGETSQMSIRYTFTDDDVGSQYFRLIADYYSEVEESNETNNAAMVGPFQVVTAPVPAPTPTNTPTPTRTPIPIRMPTATPVPTNTPAPTPTPEGPVVTLHAESKEVVTGQPVNVSLSVRNIASNPDMTVDVIVGAPQGLLLSGESCPSSGQCSATYDLTADEGTGRIEMTATAHEAGVYTLEAVVNWSIPNVGSATITTPLELSFTDSIVVDLHADRTEVVVGEPVVLTFDATNSIANPLVMARLSLTRPSGWSVSEAEYAESCAVSCVGNFSISSGQLKSIIVEMVPNQPGIFPIEANLEWELEHDSNRIGTAMDSLTLTVIPQGAQAVGTSGGASGTSAGTQPDESGGQPGTDPASPWWLTPTALLAWALLAIVIIVVTGYLAIVRSVRAARHEPPTIKIE